MIGERVPDGGLNERYSEEYILPLAKGLIYICTYGTT